MPSSRPWMIVAVVLTALAVMDLFSNPSRADEGMWLFNNPPRKILKEKYDFDPIRRVAGPLRLAVGPVQ